MIGIIALPDFPADADWGLRLTGADPVPAPDGRARND